MDHLAAGQIAIGGVGKALAMALGERDRTTCLHCDHVVELAESFGRYCGLGAANMSKLRLCGQLHDIGMIGIPENVLRKAGRLDSYGWAEMHSHPERGQHIVEAIDIDGIDEVALCVRQHHEHFDGSGYPDGLSGEGIHFLARMVAIIDAYDAMASPWPYHRARDHAEIMRILRDEAGGKYDPMLVSLFEHMMAGQTVKHPEKADPHDVWRPFRLPGS